MNIKDLKPGSYQFTPTTTKSSKMNVRDIQPETPAPTPATQISDATWKKPKLYTDIAQGVQDTLAGSGAETIKRATEMPKGTPVKSWKEFGKNLLNPKTYTSAIKDAVTLVHGLAQAARTDAAFVPKQSAKVLKEVITGKFFDEGDQVRQNPTLGNDESFLGKANAMAEGFLTDISKILPLLGLTEVTEALPGNTSKIPGMNKVNPVLEQHYVQKNISEWKEPVTINKPGYSEAKKIYENAKSKGSNIPETLTKNKIEVSSNVENGNYSTSDVVNKIYDDVGKLSKEVLRPSLEAADQFTPRTPLEEIIRTAKKNIMSGSETPGNKTTLIKNLETELESLQSQYPEGLNLTEKLDNKILYDKNSRYNTFGDIATSNMAKLNKAIADSLRTHLEDAAPPGLPVHEFHAEQTKQYQAADYLESLNGKKVPQTKLQYVAKTAAKVAGAGAGHGLGGGILGSVGGYHIGGMLESFIENLPNPIKTQFLNNLKVSNPEAFRAVQQFLHENLKAQINTKALPPPSQMQAGPRTYEQPQIEVLPAEKQVYRDPKTGQMKRGYKSTSDK